MANVTAHYKAVKNTTTAHLQNADHLKRPTVLQDIANKIVQNDVVHPRKRVVANQPNKQVIAKQCATKRTTKQPTIVVRATKSCQLRIQHNRKSIDKQFTKGNEPAPKSNVLNETKDKENTKKCVPPPPKPKAVLEVVKSTRLDLPAFSSKLLDSVLSVEDIEDIDDDDNNDPLMLGVYAKDMYTYLWEMEIRFPIRIDYLKDSKLNAKMRATLLDWLVEVQTELNMLPETLYLTVGIVDRYLQEKPTTPKNELQLVGVTSMFIASKYEEMFYPQIKDLVYLSDNAFSKDQLILKEMAIVKVLNFSFGRPLPIHFLRRYSKAAQACPLTHTLAKYILEMSILCYDVCHLRPSLLAATSLYLALSTLYPKNQVWTNTLIHYSTYKEEDILPIARQLLNFLKTPDLKFQAISRKYSRKGTFSVSTRIDLRKLDLSSKK